MKLISLNETAPPGYFANYTKIHQGVEAGFELYVAIHCIAILTSIILLVMYKRLVGSESVRRMSPWVSTCMSTYKESFLILYFPIGHFLQRFLWLVASDRFRLLDATLPENGH